MRSNSLDVLYFGQAKIYAVLLLHATMPSFAIPIIKLNENSNIEYTPTVDLFGEIDGFMPIHRQGKIIDLDRTIAVNIGHEEVFAFVDSDGKAIVGKKKDIVRSVKKSAGLVADIACSLNFALFCNDDIRSEELGKKVFKQKVYELNDERAALRWFASAFICLPVFKEILKLTLRKETLPNDDFTNMLPKIIMLRTSVVTIVFPDDTFDHNDISIDDINYKLKNLFKFAYKSTNHTFVIGNSSDDYDPRFSSQSSRKEPQNITKVLSHKQQERRLAEILSIYINYNDNFNNSFINSYIDKAKYTNTALDILREKARSRGVTQADRIDQVASIIPQLVRAAFPHQRGRVILELARVLGVFTDISNMIRFLISNSSQREVVEVEAAAERLMTKSKRHTDTSKI